MISNVWLCVVITLARVGGGYSTLFVCLFVCVCVCVCMCVCLCVTTKLLFKLNYHKI